VVATHGAATSAHDCPSCSLERSTTSILTAEASAVLLSTGRIVVLTPAVSAPRKGSVPLALTRGPPCS
jgi:hypothetical protein